MKYLRMTNILFLLLVFTLASCGGGDSDSVDADGNGEGIIGADGVAGHPTSDLIGTWVFRQVTVNQIAVDLGEQLEFHDGAVEARLHILENSAYLYEEVDFRGGQIWAEWGFIYFNQDEFDLNQQFDTNGAQQRMVVYDYIIGNGLLNLTDTSDGNTVVYTLTM